MDNLILILRVLEYPFNPLADFPGIPVNSGNGIDDKTDFSHNAFFQ